MATKYTVAGGLQEERYILVAAMDPRMAEAQRDPSLHKEMPVTISLKYFRIFGHPVWSWSALRSNHVNEGREGMAGRKNNQRPVYLNLLRIHLPVGAVVSILHRVTGVLLVVSLPFSLLLLQRSLASAEDYGRVTALLHSLPARILLLVLLVTLAHHFFAGVRHLFLDLDIGISRNGGKRGAWLVLAAVATAGAIAAGCLFL